MRIRSLYLLAFLLPLSACSSFGKDEAEPTWMEARRGDALDTQTAKAPDYIPSQTFSRGEQAQMDTAQGEVLAARNTLINRLDEIELDQEDTDTYLRDARERARAPELPDD